MSKSVAILGASTDRSKYGNKSVRAHKAEGWTVYPVNPKADEVEGEKAYASLADVPHPVTRISVYLPASVGIRMLPEIAATPHEELFFNPGSESEELIAAAQAQGLKPLQACSIVAIGQRPGNFQA
jgi:predicted CoA-binding protein